MDQRLKPKQVEGLLIQQQRLRKVVGEQDFQLLKQALTQQFVMNILVYVLVLMSFSWSAYLWVQSQGAPGEWQTLLRSSRHQPSRARRGNSPNVVSNGSGAGK